MSFRTRFAPSPTGPLHLGHAYSAIVAHDMAAEHAGIFLVRIEDIDQSRARPEWEDQIFRDLEWLGLKWDPHVVRQSEHMDRYQEELVSLWKTGILYPCVCKRRDILNAANAPQEGAPVRGPDGIVYPGTCRTKTSRTGALPTRHALRLDLEKLLQTLPPALSYQDTGLPHPTVSLNAETLTQTLGDIVVARQDMGTSYHLSVVLDDAMQKITHVVRGNDLAEATQIHVLLQRALGLETPVYHHHKLIRDDTGKRLAKRDDARAISKFRNDGYTPKNIRKMLGL